jgi:hypothetical protein
MPPAVQHSFPPPGTRVQLALLGPQDVVNMDVEFKGLVVDASGITGFLFTDVGESASATGFIPIHRVFCMTWTKDDAGHAVPPMADAPGAAATAPVDTPIIETPQPPTTTSHIKSRVPPGVFRTNYSSQSTSRVAIEELKASFRGTLRASLSEQYAGLAVTNAMHTRFAAPQAVCA